MAIMVTGASGQLGRALMNRLGPRGIPCTRPEYDLANARQVGDAVRKLRPHVVINCAAYTQVDRAEAEPEPCRLINGNAVEELAQACQDVDATLVQVSTDYVFGGDTHHNQPYLEDDPPAPLSVYGESKLLGERAAAVCSKHFIVRTCGLYAYAPTPANFVEKILVLAATRPRLTVVNDQYCSPTYVEHLADALLFLSETHAYGIYHVVNRGGVTWFDFAREILTQQQITTPLEPVSSAEFHTPARRPPYSVLNTDKYHACGGPPMPDWRQALHAYLQARG